MLSNSEEAQEFHQIEIHYLTKMFTRTRNPLYAWEVVRHCDVSDIPIPADIIKNYLSPFAHWLRIEAWAVDEKGNRQYNLRRNKSGIPDKFAELVREKLRFTSGKQGAVKVGMKQGDYAPTGDLYKEMRKDRSRIELAMRMAKEMGKELLEPDIVKSLKITPRSRTPKSRDKAALDLAGDLAAGKDLRSRKKGGGKVGIDRTSLISYFKDLYPEERKYINDMFAWQIKHSRGS